MHLIKIYQREEIKLESKRAIAIIVILIALAIIVVAGYKLGSSYIWSTDGITNNEHTEVIEKIKNESDQVKKEEQVKLLLETKTITQSEAEEILNN